MWSGSKIIPFDDHPADQVAAQVGQAPGRCSGGPVRRRGATPDVPLAWSSAPKMPSRSMPGAPAVVGQVVLPVIVGLGLVLAARLHLPELAGLLAKFPGSR